MKYALPKTRRRIFFYVSALAFLAIAPFLVLYSFGYVVNRQQKTVEKTGGIFVKTNLAGFTVSLNNGAIQKSSLLTRGLLLSNLSPGQYRLRVEKENYRPWEKIISVTQFSVREIRNVVLLPDYIASENAAIWSAEEYLERIFVSPETRYAALELKNGKTQQRTLLFFKTSENKITARFQISSAVQQIIWNADENAALLVAGNRSREYQRLAFTDAALTPMPVFGESVLMPGNGAMRRIAQADIKKIAFGNAADAFIMLTDAGSLLFWNSATTSAGALAENIEEFEALDDAVFFIAKNGFAILQSLRDGATANLGRKGHALTGAPIAALQTKKSDLFFKDGAGGLFFSSRENRGELELLETGVQTVALDRKETKLFFKKQNAIGIFRLENNPYQPFETRGTKQELLQSNDTALLDAAWYAEDDAHIILNTSGGVFLLDTDIRDGPRLAELDARPAQKIFWSQNEKKLYLIRDTGIETIAIE